MFRLIRFLIITFTLGRIKWLMRLTWIWRLIVFAGITGWLSKKLSGAIGLGKSPATDVDSAWADALRYTPAPAAAGFAGPTPFASAPNPAPATSEVIEESLSEVTGYAADGAAETITMHEVQAGGETETIIRIEDDAGNVETLITGAPVEEIDLANLGEPAPEIAEPPVEVAEIETIEAVEIVEIVEIVGILEAAEPEVAPETAAPKPPKPKRIRKPAANAVVAEPAEPLEVTDEESDANLIITPDWVRSDGSDECPDAHPVKAKATSMIYYVPESRHYGLTNPDVCFASSADAEAAGYRAPRR